MIFPSDDSPARKPSCVRVGSQQIIASSFQTSPSGFNLQPTAVLLIRSPEIKTALSKHAMLGGGNQFRTTDASVVAAFTADLQPAPDRVERIRLLEKHNGRNGSAAPRPEGYESVYDVASTFLTGGRGTGAANLFQRAMGEALSPVQPMPTFERVESWSYKNAGIMAQTFSLAATAHGLATCMMEGFDARRARDILRIPDRYGIPLMVTMGYDYDNGDNVLHVEEDEIVEDESGDLDSRRHLKTARLDLEEVFFGDTFGEELEFLRSSSSLPPKSLGTK